jgi:REP element-mobilizing transposase RayT
VGQQASVPAELSEGKGRPDSSFVEEGGGQQSHHIARAYLGRRQSFVGQHFWPRGDCVSSVGRDEAGIREYIQKPQEEKKRLDHLTMFGE